MTKYRAKPTVIDGVRFASKKEAARYCALKLREKIGDISNLTLQPVFPIVIGGQPVAKYVADFSYFHNGAYVVEDVKGMRTPVYRLKKKLVEALYPGVKIMEV